MLNLKNQLLGVHKKIKALILGVLLLAIYVALMAYKPIGDWKLSLLILNYQDFGFVKRGLLGSLIPSVWVCADGLALIGLCMDIALALTLVALVLFWIKRNRNRDATYALSLWAVIAVIAPYSIAQIFMDVARTDHVVLFAVIIGFSALLYRKWGEWLALGIHALAPLLHEASVLLILPPFWMGWLLINHCCRRSLVMPIVSIFLTALTFGTVIFFGKIALDLAGILAIVEKKSLDFRPNQGAFATVTRSLMDNLVLTQKAYPRKLLEIAGVVLFMFPFWWYLREHQRVLALKLPYCFWLPLSCMSILPLFVFGVDLFRWIAGILLSYWVVLCLLLVYLDLDSELIRCISLYPRRLWGLVFVAIWMGPLGVMSYFPDPWVLIVGN